ncbi:MAG: bacillithiol biosynthesis cysteine-adding enzyme BshC [Bacteroidota bacterium]
MQSSCRYIDYQDTNMFSRLISDYLDKKEFIQDFFAYHTDLEGVANAITARQSFSTDRSLIQRVFADAYATGGASTMQLNNIADLSDENTFTICTAHQPNIFSGYLYFIYKTAHVIALSQQFAKAFPDKKFVPVFYIGSEDNDLDELSKFKIHGRGYVWNTDQTGAVGRMTVDKGVIKLIDEVESELKHLPNAASLISMLREAYAMGNDMATGTFILLNALFKSDGLLVLQPDHSELKSKMKSVFKDDLLHNSAEQIVGATNIQLEAEYKLQVNPRNVNLFYLRDGIRNRIDKRGNIYTVDGTVIRFTEEEILQELNEYPDRFSPNVILRGIYQETILPNILFVGGGSEVAYWMQLKNLFAHYHVPFPMLVLRNSFMVMDANHAHKMAELGIGEVDLFKEETQLANELVQRWSGSEISLKQEELDSKALFQHLKKRAGDIDKTLVQHVHALETDHLKKLDGLEKKMLKAERKKQAIQLQRIWKLKEELFPNHSLQERVDNFMPYYAQHGQAFIEAVLQHSLGLEQRFGVVVL